MQLFVSVNNYEPAYFGAGTKLTVLEPGTTITKPTVKIFEPSTKECRDPNKKRKKTLVCEASGFYPDHVTMFWNMTGGEMQGSVATDSTAQREEGRSYKLTSRLRVPAEQWFSKETNFTCTVNFFDGEKTTSHSDWIASNKDDVGLTRKKYLSITQNAKLSYIVLIVKSCLYGAFVFFVVWKLQRSGRKQKK